MRLLPKACVTPGGSVHEHPEGPVLGSRIIGFKMTLWFAFSKEYTPDVLRVVGEGALDDANTERRSLSGEIAE